jgi:hypothetical protein
VLSELLKNEKFPTKKLNSAIPSKIIRLNKIRYKLSLGTFLVNINNEFLKFKMFSSDYPAVGWPPRIPLICNYTLSDSLFIAASTDRFLPDGQKIIIKPRSSL